MPYQYNLAGDLVSENLNSRRTLTTTYDNVRRPLTLASSTTTYVSQTAYLLYGLPWYFVRGNNVWHVRSYNNRMQQTESYEALNNSTYYFISCPNWGQDTSNYGTGNTCPHYSGANDNGTLQSYREYLGNSSNAASLSWFNDAYTYDGLNRVNTATDKDQNNNLEWARTYNFDQWGNMWEPNPYGNPWNGSTPTTNLYAGNNKNQNGNLSYDLAGNVSSVNSFTASYNAENQLSSLSATIGGGAETLSYDAVGQRVQKAISGGTSTVYFYDAFGQLASESLNGSWSRDYIRDGTGNLVATENSGGPCTTCYFSYDHLGSVRLVTDQNGNVVARHDYLPYGEEVSGYSGRTMAGFSIPGGSVPNDVTQKFTGQVRDQESGEDYFNARYFTPVFGRFNSPDPQNAGASLLSSQSWNGYGYVGANPLGATDPSGMDECDSTSPGTLFCVQRNEPTCSGDFCETSTTSANPAPVGTWAWWMDGGWRILINGGNTPSQVTSGGGSSTQPKHDINKTWSKTFACNGNAQQLMARVQNDMGEFADNRGTLFATAFPRQPLRLGSNYAIMPGLNTHSGGNEFPTAILAVTVTSQSTTGWTFTTNPAQHFFDGTVSFSANNAGNGNVTFSINAQANYSSELTKYTLGPLIEAGENSNWNNMLAAVQGYCQAITF